MADHQVDPHIQVLKETMEKALLAMDQSLVIPLHRLCFQDQVPLGVGGFGLVRKATLDTDSNIVAVKQLYTSGDGEDRILQGIAFIRELKVWTRIEHPHIVRLLGFYWDGETDNALFISSYEPTGTLFRYLRNGHPSPDKRLELASDTADGLTYLHELIPPICHGDLTSRNIVITADFRAKICDFGLAKVVEETSSGLTTETFNAKGAARYRGPELDLPGARRTLKSDMWAWSCVAFEILTTVIPYDELKDYQVTPESTKDKLPATLDNFNLEPAMKRMLLRCWASEPRDRAEIRSCFNDIVRERSRLQAKALLPCTNLPVTVDSETVLHTQMDNTLESLSHLRADISWLEKNIGRSPAFGGLTRVDAMVIVQPFCGFTLGEEVAAETLFRSYAGGEADTKQAWEVIQRLRQWSTWSHPNLVELRAFYFRPGSPVPRSISAFEVHGGLDHFLKQQVLSQADRLKLAIGTAKGVTYLHTRRPPICHGDVNVSNVVVDSGYRAKICSFMSASLDGLTNEEFRGTTAWAAPECLSGEQVVLGSDVWAWAGLCAQIFGLSYPWNGMSDYQIIYQVMVQKNLPWSTEVLSALPAPLKDLLLQCWQFDADQRPSIQYCQHVLTEMFLNSC